MNDQLVQEWRKRAAELREKQKRGGDGRNQGMDEYLWGMRATVYETCAKELEDDQSL